MKALKKLFIIITMLIPAILFAGCNDEVTVDELVQIEVDRSFVEKKYYVGDSVETDDYSLKLIYSSGYTTYVDLSDAIITGVNSSVAGKNEITITYNEVSQVVELTFVEPKVDAIRYTGDAIHFYVGETASLEGITLLAHKENGEETTLDIEDCTIGAIDLSVSDEERELEVSYGDARATIKYDVSYREIDISQSYELKICFDSRELTAVFNERNGQLFLMAYAVSDTDNVYPVFSFHLDEERDNLYSTWFQSGDENKMFYVYLANDTLIISQNPN